MKHFRSKFLKPKGEYLASYDGYGWATNDRSGEKKKFFFRVQLIKSLPLLNTFRHIMFHQRDLSDRLKSHPLIAMRALRIWQGSFWRKYSFSAGSRYGKVSTKTSGFVITLRGSSSEICSRIQASCTLFGAVIRTCSSRSPSIKAIFVHWDAQEILNWSRSCLDNASISMEHIFWSRSVKFRERIALKCVGMRSLGRSSRYLVSGRPNTLQE